MALRKEYHKALAAQGLTFDKIVGVIGQEMYEGEKSADRLNAAKTLLKSLGMEKYDNEMIGGGGNWEDLILEAAEKNAGGDQNEVLELGDYDDYAVDTPAIPAEVKIIKDDELEVGKGLYE